jgi:hypothetical protein
MSKREAVVSKCPTRYSIAYRRDEENSSQDKDRIFSHGEWIVSSHERNSGKQDSRDNDHARNNGDDNGTVFSWIVWVARLLRYSLKFLLEKGGDGVFFLWYMLIVVDGQSDRLGRIRRGIEESAEDDQSYRN